MLNPLIQHIHLADALIYHHTIIYQIYHHMYGDVQIQQQVLPTFIDMLKQ